MIIFLNDGPIIDLNLIKSSWSKQKAFNVQNYKDKSTKVWNAIIILMEKA